ncbi:hypothetical protein GJ496_004255 [Pomphorhynchus laevis]|nr:hypothetical protein GJ496_004255 [Pomphorhynchus laevis]
MKAEIINRLEHMSFDNEYDPFPSSEYDLRASIQELSPFTIIGSIYNDEDDGIAEDYVKTDNHGKDKVDGNVVDDREVEYDEKREYDGKDECNVDESYADKHVDSGFTVIGVNNLHIFNVVQFRDYYFIANNHLHYGYFLQEITCFPNVYTGNYMKSQNRRSIKSEERNKIKCKLRVGICITQLI